MANVNSLTTNSYSSTSSIYGNRNVLTGLASGMDTEAMIQNSVSGYQTKIQQLQQSTTKLEWKQDAYRDLIDQMYGITQKYTSYTSKTNLASNSFFTNSVTTSTQGSNADAISATGKATSDIRINEVSQLATAARYSVKADALSFNGAQTATGDAIDWTATQDIGQVKGTITLKYGSQSVDLKFDETDNDITSVDKLEDAINKKLANISVTTTKGTAKASELFNVRTDDDGTFTFTANRGSGADDGSAVYINSISGNVAQMLGASRPASTTIEDRVANNSFTVGDFSALVKTQSTAEYLSGKTLDVTLDGTTKQIKIGNLASDATTESLVADLQSSLNDAFGTGKVTVLNQNGGLDFSVASDSGSLLKVASGSGETVGNALGIDKNGLTNYFNTSSSLSKLLSSSNLDAARMKAADGPINTSSPKYYDSEGYQVKRDTTNNTYYRVDSNGNFVTSNGSKVVASGSINTLYTDSEGNLVKEDQGVNYRVNEKGEWLLGMEINGKTIDGFTADSSLESVLNKINSDADTGVNVSYSNLTGEFVFTARETGAGGKIEFGDGLAKRLFGGNGNSGSYTEGQDAVIKATVNGTDLTLKRASNVVQMDGLTVTLRDTFSAYDENNSVKAADAVTFETKANADDIVDVIKSFVDDVNKLMTDVHSAFATVPAEKSSTNHTRYEPLTDDDKASMSESAIAAYEEKAKQGLLFGDTDLSTLYDKLRDTITSYGSDRIAMESIGLTTSYSNGVTTLSLNENELRAALDRDPDGVRNVFAKTIEGGSSTNGLMAKLKSTMNSYASTSSGSPGILVRKAGTKLSSLSLLDNNLQSQIDNISKQIESWQTKLSNKIDYYTTQFTALEKLMNTMNEQSSALAQLMGY